tara:strand:+ start:197 stop:466 length:270 start_codon:yes stop_codon:yes gene_type:complete
MARVIFTQQLARFTAAPSFQTSAATVGAALEQAFADNPALRSYLLDDQGELRKHVVVFIDGQRWREPRDLQTPLAASSTVYFLQALSGG